MHVCLSACLATRGYLHGVVIQVLVRCETTLEMQNWLVVCNSWIDILSFLFLSAFVGPVWLSRWWNRSTPPLADNPENNVSLGEGLSNYTWCWRCVNVVVEVFSCKRYPHAHHIANTKILWEITISAPFDDHLLPPLSPKYGKGPPFIFIFTSRLSGRGNGIGAVFLSSCFCLSVCLCVSTLMAERFGLWPWILVGGLTLTLARLWL